MQKNIAGHPRYKRGRSGGPLRVRDGVVGPQMDVFPDGSYKVYYGGEHQYEFIDFLGSNNWKNFLNVADAAGIILK